MGARADTITVEVLLPRDDYARVEAEARKYHRPVSEVLPRLIEDGLLSRMSAREIMERVSAAYRLRRAASGDRELTAEELIEKLRRDREEIVNERYP